MALQSTSSMPYNVPMPPAGAAIADLQNKMKELRLKNWIDMEALANADLRIKEIQTVADQEVEYLEKATVLKQQEISSKNKPPCELIGRPKQAESEIPERLSEYNKEIEKNGHFSSERIKLNESNNSRTDEALKSEELKSDTEESRSETEECLERLFPVNASVDSSLEIEDLTLKLDEKKEISEDFSSQMTRLNSLVKFAQDALKVQQELDKKLKEQLATSQEIEDLKSKLDEKKEISKDFSSQMIRLNSLVKIGQDALKAQQELEKKVKEQLETSQELCSKDHNVNSEEESSKESTFGNTNRDSLVSVPVSYNSDFSFGATVQNKSSSAENTTSSSLIFTPTTSDIPVTNFKSGSTKGTIFSTTLFPLPVMSNSIFSFGTTVQSKSSVAGIATSSSSVFTPPKSVSAFAGFSLPVTSNSNQSSGATVQKSSISSDRARSLRRVTRNSNLSSSVIAPSTTATSLTFGVPSLTVLSQPNIFGNHLTSSSPPSFSFNRNAQSNSRLSGITTPGFSFSTSSVSTSNLTCGIPSNTAVAAFDSKPAPVFGQSTFQGSTPKGTFENTCADSGLFGQAFNSFGALASTCPKPSAAAAFYSKPAPVFGQSTFQGSTLKSTFGNTCTDSGLFGQASCTFGALASTCPQPSGFCTTITTGMVVKFNPPTGTDTIMKYGVSTSIGIRLQCITCMKEYESKSLEELREEDYAAGRHGRSGKGIAFGKIIQTDLGSITWTGALRTAPLTSVLQFGTTVTTIAIKKIQEDFSKLLVSEEDSDIMFKVQGKIIRAHKAILRARSPVLKSMFSHDMIEKEKGTVTIDDIDFSTFQNFLNFIYTGGIEHINEKNVFNLYKVSDKYDVQELKIPCLMFMERKLSVDLLCDAISLALLYNEENLKNLTIKFFCRNALEVLVTPKWMSFLASNLIAGNELLIKALSQPCPFCKQKIEDNLEGKNATEFV